VRSVEINSVLKTEIAIPEISVVIPTCNRPDLVERAVNSVLRQTLRALEIIVVIDGDNPATIARLNRISDQRLGCVVLHERSGAAVARNIGVSHARAEWVAFLDDDDEMLPERLARQLSAAQASSAKYPVIVCRYFVQSSKGKYIYPDLLPGRNEDVSEYLFDRRGLTGAIGGIGTSTMFVRRELLISIPFPDLPRHEDWAWVLECSKHAGWELQVISEPLTIVHVEPNVASISRPVGRREWSVSLKWARRYRQSITPRAYASLLSIPIARMAREDGAWWAAPYLLVEALRFGRPRLSHIALFCAIWMLPKCAQQIPYAIRRWSAKLSSKRAAKPRIRYNDCGSAI
jgi:glycosyltransferase involved in cell wall biosynthesis